MTSPPFLWVYMIYASATVAILVLLGIAATLKTAGKPADYVARTVWAACALLFGWLAMAALLGWLGLFQASADSAIPWIAFAILIPLAVGVTLLNRSQATATLLRTISQSWLVGVQFYRGLGSMFLVLYGMKFLPREFALPAGLGDVAVGMLALPVAAYYAANLPHRNLIVTAWNIFGLTDLVVAVATGFLSAPTPLQMLSFDSPNLLMGMFPAVLIPTFAVPLSIVLHIASLKKVLMDSRLPIPTQVTG